MTVQSVGAFERVVGGLTEGTIRSRVAHEGFPGRSLPMKTRLRASHLWIFTAVWASVFAGASVIAGFAEQWEIGFDLPLIEAWRSTAPRPVEWEDVLAGPAPGRRWVRFPASTLPGEYCQITENYTSGKQNTRYHRVFLVTYLRSPDGGGAVLLASTLVASSIRGHVSPEDRVLYHAPDPAESPVTGEFQGMLVTDEYFAGRVEFARSRGAPDWRLVLNAHPKFWTAGIAWTGILGVAAGLGALWLFAAGRAIRDVRFEIDRKECRLGERMRWELLVRMKSSHVIDRAIVVFTCTEQTVVGSGKSSRVLKEAVHEERRTLGERVTLDPKRPGEWRGEFLVPAGAMHTFRGRPHQVTWKIAYAIEIPGLLDLLDEREIVVRPEQVREAAE